MTNHEKYMKRCIELAKLAFGNAAPNPMVGSVIVHNDRIIGEGYHKKCGLAHAEVNAINSVKNKELLSSSTLYVNLEPCAHHGKTPPCSDLIVAKGIPNVVIGCVDIFAKVAGKGIEKLRKAGCNVTVGVLEQESIDLNKRFFTFHSKKRPYIILKWAETLDGFIDIDRRGKNPIEPYWISNKLSKKLVHKWRTQEDAFMIGTNTAINDNPQLTVREWHGRNPIRVVLDNKLRLPANLKLFDKQATTIVFNSLKNESYENVEYIKISFDNNMLNELISKLYTFDIQSVVIEGGRELLDSFIQKKLWDEARVFIGNKYFIKGTKAPKFSEIPDNVEMVGDSKLRHYFKANNHDFTIKNLQSKTKQNNYL